ncbi:MAG: hypothetical protein JNM69_42240 [Archangium sp.]|nr:hypothetical protein [Archangium sp.]
MRLLLTATVLLTLTCSPIMPFKTDAGEDAGSAGGSAVGGGSSGGGAAGGTIAGGVAAGGSAGGASAGGSTAGGASAGGASAGGATAGGASCGGCSAPTNATPVCADGGCDFACVSGFHRCGNHCAADDSVLECGSTCSSCPDNGGSASCSLGVCGVTCAPDRAKCAGACVPESNTQCGPSCVSCQAPAQCRAGQCVQSCPLGQVLVGGQCSEGRAIAMGNLHGCARHDGGVVCWGTGVSTGSLGSGMDGGRNPQFVTGLGDVTSLSLGDNFSCGLLPSGSVRCWGDNMFGQVGNGGTNNAYTQQVALASNVTSFGAGARHACALLDDAGVVCWGTGISGQLGSGGFPLAVRAPQPMALDSGVSALFVVNDATFTQHQERGLRLTGDVPFYGQGAAVPTPVAIGDGGVRVIRTSANHGCLIRGNRTLECWGRGFEGQLGVPVSVTNAQPLRAVPGLGEVVDVCTGQSFTCAVIADAGVRCFGAGAFGQLGGGNFNPSTTPVEVIGLAPATQVACHYQTVCALTAQGVFCWGDNALGQLGAPTPMSTSQPLPVPMP